MRRPEQDTAGRAGLTMAQWPVSTSYFAAFMISGTASRRTAS